jgi:hypothetical protein
VFGAGRNRQEIVRPDRNLKKQAFNSWGWQEQARNGWSWQDHAGIFRAKDLVRLEQL